MQNSSNTLNINQVLVDSFKLFKVGFPTYITYGLIYSWLSFLNALFPQRFENPTLNHVFFVSLVTIVLATWVTMALIFTTSCFIKRRKVSFPKAFQYPKGRFIKYLAVKMTKEVLTAIGFILFIIPGIYIGAIFIFADVIMALENTRFIESFERSFRLVRGRIFPVIIFTFMVLALFFIPMMAIQLIHQSNAGLGKTLDILFAAIFIPFFTIAQVILYHRVKELAPVEEVIA